MKSHLIVLLTLTLVACSSSNDQEGMAKAPVDSPRASGPGVGRELKGIKLGDSLKSIQANGTDWKVYDYSINDNAEGLDNDLKSPARIHSTLDVPNKTPRIDVFGDGPDIDYARVEAVQVFYLNYDKMDINRDDFVKELESRWGEPSHRVFLGSDETYYWLDRQANSLGVLELNRGPWGPRMVVSLYNDSKHIQPEKYSPEKVKDILK